MFALCRWKTLVGKAEGDDGQTVKRGKANVQIGFFPKLGKEDRKEDSENFRMFYRNILTFHSWIWY